MDCWINMFYRIKNTVKKIIIQEIQELVKEHPEFHDTLVVNRYQDQEREKVNVIIKSASASSQRLGLDNHGLTAESYTSLANLKGQRGDMIEWVRDDAYHIQDLVPPGFYVVKMISLTEFVIEQYLTIRNELLDFNSIDTQGRPLAKLKHDTLNLSSEVITDDTGRRFVRNQHYSIDYDTGLITFLVDITGYYEIFATYQYLRPQLGPFVAKAYEINNVALPGVVLAFGDRLREGDIQVVVVSDKREPSALVSTGSWEMNIDMEIRAQDTNAAEQLLDYIASTLWAVKQIELADRGITITEFSAAGESEEQEMDVPDEWSFSDTLSLSLVVQWELHIPILGRVERIYIKPPIDTGIYDSVMLAEYENLYTQNANYESFGTVEDAREGRYSDFNEGDRHFAGLVPVESTKSVVVYPSIYL